MPRPQVPNQDIPARHTRLHRRTHAPPCLFDLVRDPGDVLPCLVRLHGDGAVFVDDLLVFNGRVDRRTEPKLCGTIDNVKVAEGDVGDEVVRAGRVVKGGIFVFCLAQAWGVGDGGVGCEPVPNGFWAEISVPC